MFLLQNYRSWLISFYTWIWALYVGPKFGFFYLKENCCDPIQLMFIHIESYTRYQRNTCIVEIQSDSKQYIVYMRTNMDRKKYWIHRKVNWELNQN